MDNEGVEAGVVLGLGSNLGDREAAIKGALARLAARGFRQSLQSSLYLTEPVGGPPQDHFLNAVAAGETELSPEALLDACLAVELALGRERRERTGPRTIDVALLLLSDITLPRLGRSVAELLRGCADSSDVTRYAGAPA